MKLTKWFRSWQIRRAVKASNRRMDSYTQEQRRELYERGLDTVFPDGRWMCMCHSKSRSIGVWVARGKTCQLCGKGER